MTLDPADDWQRSLIEGLRAGRESSFQEAVRTYTPAMLVVARYYVDRQTAEDVVQEVWLKVIRAIQGFEGRSSLGTWLHRIVANQAKNALRHNGREVSMTFEDTLEPALAERFNAQRHWQIPPALKSGESAEQWLESEALRQCLDAHLSCLPEQQRSALMLYEVEQHRSDDVCNILEVTSSNLRVLLHRARQRIFMMVENFQETGEC